MDRSSTQSRIFGLDILRAAAILFVMQMHSLTFLYPHTDTHYYWLFILDGVDLFFVLSGFLIGGILIRTIDKGDFNWRSLSNFWIRRWFRTLPNYFLVLVVLIAGYYYYFNEFPDKAFRYFIFTQNFNDPHPGFFGEAWSLSVEEWFYLIVPLGLFFLLKLKGNKKYLLLGWICLIIIAVTSYRFSKAIGFNIEEDNWDKDIRKLVLTRMDSIMFGFLGAWLAHYYNTLWGKFKNGLLITGLLILFGSRWQYSESSWYSQYVYISAQSIGTLLLLPKLSSIVNGKGIFYRAITFISIISYSLYLLNFTIVLKFIIPQIMKLTGMNYQTNLSHSMIGYVLFWAISIGLSYLLYRSWERPMMGIRERFFVGRKKR